MHDDKLRREIQHLQAMLVLLSSGIVFLTAVGLLLLLDVLQGVGCLAAVDSGAVVTIVILGVLLFMIGVVYPTLRWLWYRFQTADGGVA